MGKRGIMNKEIDVIQKLYCCTMEKIACCAFLKNPNFCCDNLVKFKNNEDDVVDVYWMKIIDSKPFRSTFFAKINAIIKSMNDNSSIIKRMKICRNGNSCMEILLSMCFCTLHRKFPQCGAKDVINFDDYQRSKSMGGYFDQNMREWL